jgi:outer membrane protein assembly factor BamB
MADKPIVASPVINNGRVFCGGSDGHFRCYDLASGNLIWDFADVKGFVVTRPVINNGKIYFGGWGNYFYALNEQTGALAWSWTNGSANRMFSPASCVPVITNNRVFIVAPDRFMTCLNATTGAVIWRKGDPKIRIREAMGVSADSTLIYGKTMEGDVLGFSTKADSMEVTWKAKRNIGYDISPSLIEERSGLVFTLSNSGNIYAFKREDGELAWVHKLSNCLVNPLSFFNDNQLIGTTMDGKIACLKYY